MSTPSSKNTPNNLYPLGAIRDDLAQKNASDIPFNLVTGAGLERLEEILRAVVSQGILAGQWGLIAGAATCLDYLRGVPDSAPTPTLDDLIDAAQFARPGVPRGRVPMFYSRTAGDTPEGEDPRPPLDRYRGFIQPYDDTCLDPWHTTSVQGPGGDPQPIGDQCPTCQDRA